MKVALIGNMNNNFFCLARYLRDLNIEADMLLLKNEQHHFLPAADTFDDAYKTYIRRVQWGDVPSFTATPAQSIAADLAPYDVIIACNYGPAFVHKAGRRVDIFGPHGSDITEVPFYGAADGNPAPVAVAQRKAIANAAYMASLPTNARIESIYDQVRPTGKRIWVCPPLVYMPEYSPEHIARCRFQASQWERVQDFRERFGVMVFHHARHVWQSGPADDKKGNDILLRGLADICCLSMGADLGLICFEYGPDVSASQQLAEDLGIGERVLWLPLSPRREIMCYLSLADLVATEFAHSWITGGVLFEGLCLGKPIMGRRDDDFYQHLKLYPILNASSSRDVTQMMSAYLKDIQRYQDWGQQGQVWLKTHLDHTVDEFVKVIEEAAGPNYEAA